MAGRRWDRIRRRKDDAAPENESVHIADDDEHAWWAARETLESDRAPTRRNKRRVDPTEEPKESGFEQYFSTESLFQPPPEDGGDDAIDLFDQRDPYAVLGVPSTATWEEITAAHRRLAKLHHPDRQGDSSGEERESSDRRIRELNIAYMELRRRKGR